MHHLPDINKSWKALTHWADAQQIRQHEDKVLFMLTLIIGATVGLVIVTFILLTENLGSRMYPAEGAAWRLIVVPVAGSLITGYLLLRYFPDARGSGIPQTKAALFLQSGIIHLRTVLGKFGCSSVSLASGIALGREGPSVQVGAGIASVLGRQLGLSPEKTKALVPIGASAALAAAFNTPIAAVLFTLEEVMGDLHARVLGAIVLSSATSWMVLRLLLGDEPLFHVPSYQLVHPIEFVFYAALGAVGGLVSVAFVRLLLKLRKHFLNLPQWTLWFQPVAGGLLVGVLGLFVPAVLGVGYSHVSEALNSRLTIGTMVLLVALKLIATATCYSSGNAGGIFGPSLFIGAMMGGAFGAAAHNLLPDYTGSVGAYALVGMGAAFAGIIRVPMTSVIMIFEVTRDYSIIVPLMIANLLSYFISSRLQTKPIYEALMHQDGIHLPKAPRERDASVFVSQGLRSAEASLQSNDTIKDVLQNIRPGIEAWPVLNENELLGMVTPAQLREAAQKGRQNQTLAEYLTSADSNEIPSAERFPHLHPDQPLDTALRRMAQSGLKLLPVVSRIKPRELLGVLDLNDSLAAYKSEHDGESVGRIQQVARTRTAALGGIAAVLVLTIGLAGFFNYFYRSQLTARAEQHGLTGKNLMEAGRYQEAVEQYRSALSISHSSEDRLALAMALEKAGRLPEAEIYFRELVRETPNSGPANLGLGRVALQQGDVRSAISFYHRSIYGQWPEESNMDAIQIRMELVEFLGRKGQLTQVRAELLALVAENPDNAVVGRRVAQLLLKYGFPEESVELLQDIIKKNPQDGTAHAGLGQAEFVLGNFLRAQQAFKTALRRDPSDAKSQQQLELVNQILALHPNLKGLRTAERYARSRKLVEAILQSLDQCLADASKPMSDSIAKAAEDARKTLARRTSPRSYGDELENNLQSAEQLWGARVDSCGPPKGANDILGSLMAQLTR